MATVLLESINQEELTFLASAQLDSGFTIRILKFIQLQKVAFVSAARLPQP